MLFSYYFYFTTYVNLYVMNDLFETTELMPDSVAEIVNRYCDGNGLSYTQCSELVKELNAIGYTCDYYLDAEPFDLRKL